MRIEVHEDDRRKMVAGVGYCASFVYFCFAVFPFHISHLYCNLFYLLNFNRIVVFVLKEQYKLLYDVVSCYLEQFSAYSNF